MQSVRTYKSSLGRHRVQFPTQGSRSYQSLHSLVQVRTQSQSALPQGQQPKKKKKRVQHSIDNADIQMATSCFSVFLLYNGSHIHQKESTRKGLRLKSMQFLIAKYTNDRSHQNNITRNAMHVLKMPTRNLQHIDPVFGQRNHHLISTSSHTQRKPIVTDINSQISDMEVATAHFSYCAHSIASGEISFDNQVPMKYLFKFNMLHLSHEISPRQNFQNPLNRRNHWQFTFCHVDHIQFYAVVNNCLPYKTWKLSLLQLLSNFQSCL